MVMQRLFWCFPFFLRLYRLMAFVVNPTGYILGIKRLSIEYYGLLAMRRDTAHHLGLNLKSATQTWHWKGTLYV